MHESRGAAPTPPPPRVALSARARRQRLIVMLLLLLASLVNYVDRASLSIANPMIRGEMGLSTAQMGLLLSAFAWAYAFSQIPAGILVDRLGPRRVQGGGIFCWSLAQIAAGLSSSLGGFLGARALLGVFESPNGPGGTKALASWFPRHRRGTPLSLVHSGGSLGTLIAPPLLTWLMLSFGWRTMFLCCGGAGVVLALVWALFFRTPAEFDLTPEERAAISEGSIGDDREPFSAAVWLRLLRHRTTWLLLGGFACMNYSTWLYLTWLPGYLELEHHVSLKHAGFLAAVPPFFAYLGALASGPLSDLMIRRGVPQLAARRRVPVVAMTVMAVVTVVMASGPSLPLALALISVSLTCSQLTGIASWTLVTTVAPQRYIASVGSMMNLGGYLFSAMAPVVVGFTVQATGSFRSSLAVGAALATVGAVLYSRLRRPILEDPDAAA